MSGWDDAASWVGDGLRRELFFFECDGRRLFGSLYAAAEPTRALGTVACSSWGIEADRTDRLVHGLALTMARMGGAGLVFHYPGYGDSEGDLADVTMDDLAAGAIAAVEQASRRCPGTDWILAGFMLGAAVACLARRAAGVDRLLLVQPALRPSEYFGGLTRGMGVVTLKSGATEERAWGYPVPRRILDDGAASDAAVEAALAGPAAGGALVRCAKPEPDGELLPPGLELVTVPAAWRFGALAYPELEQGGAAWLERFTAPSVAGSPAEARA